MLCEGICDASQLAAILNVQSCSPLHAWLLVAGQPHMDRVCVSKRAFCVFDFGDDEMFPEPT